MDQTRYTTDNLLIFFDGMQQIKPNAIVVLILCLCL